LSVWFRGHLSMREEAGLGEPDLAKLRPVGAISCPGQGRAEAGQVEGRRARSWRAAAGEVLACDGGQVVIGVVERRRVRF
jgi:hypothetical protein